MMFKKNHKHDGLVYMSTFDLLKKVFKKEDRFKNKKSLSSNRNSPPPPNSVINHLAVILDGEVQEILRAENRLAALFLSNPEFVEFDPNEIQVDIGWKYEDEVFEQGE